MHKYFSIKILTFLANFKNIQYFIYCSLQIFVIGQLCKYTAFIPELFAMLNVEKGKS